MSPTRLTGEARDKAAADLATKYRAGATLRDLAEETGHSYSLVRALLAHADVPLRPRGGARRRQPAQQGESA